MNGKARARQIIVYLIYVLLIPAFQVSFPEVIMWHNQIADLMFVFVVLTAYFYGFLDGAIVALFIGILRDYFAGPSFIGIDGKATQTLGIGVLVLFLAAAVSSSFFTLKMHRNVPFAFLSVASCTLIYKVFGHLLVGFWSVAVANSGYTLTMKQIVVDSILPQLLLNLIATIPLLLLIKFVGPYKKGKNPILEQSTERGETWLTI